MTAVPVFGPVTHAERSAWQLTALTLLSELVTTALRERVPAIRWEIDRTGTLVGSCETHQEWDGWLPRLPQLRRHGDYVRADGITFRASGSISVPGRASCYTLLIARIDAPLDRTDPAPSRDGT